jgi:Histidine kinase-, DNA gyrase B-, and HSP90-like ATPase
MRVKSKLGIHKQLLVQENLGKCRMNTQNPGQIKVVHTEPTKDFFVRMITKDISLEDCIFDLLDNSIDGARRAFEEARDQPLDGAVVNIEFDATHFSISDNCGGIRLSDAIDYAFHFGRRPDSPNDVHGGIGLYGIGMKRAIFKIGRSAFVESEASDACFRVSVDIESWLNSKDWDFEYEDSARKGINGTRIEVAELENGISASFSDPQFKNELIKIIARDYSFLLAKGLVVNVCGDRVPNFSYQLKANQNVQPSNEQYEDNGVSIRIVAGLIDELLDEIPEELMPDKVDLYGWFVVCNDRIVLAADKSSNTIWGDDGYRVWHPQYNGFAGFLFMSSQNQALLPWATTKRNVDLSNELYRRAAVRMKETTTEFVKYTNRRKYDLDSAKIAENAPGRIDVLSVFATQKMILPAISEPESPVEMANINYKRPLSEVRKIRAHLANHAMTYREIGQLTFDYYLDVEAGE